MTIYEFIREYKRRNPDGHYFDKMTLKFFVERLSDMYVLKKTRMVNDFFGKAHECYVLSSLQRNRPEGAQRKYTYFDTESFEDVMNADTYPTELRCV